MYSLPFNSIYITNYMFTCRLRRSTKPLAHYEMSRLPPRFFISVACIKSVYLSVAKSRPSKKCP